jgi:hypothetical protein
MDVRQIEIDIKQSNFHTTILTNGGSQKNIKIHDHRSLVAWGNLTEGFA